MTQKKDLEKKTEAAPPAVIDYAADAGMGMDGVDKDSAAIPYLKILQAQSPEIETVEGAKPGMFINSITKELFTFAKVIPCGFRRKFAIWQPREQGGGYKGDLTPLEVETNFSKNENGQYLTADGDLLKDTREHFVMVQSSDGTWSTAVLSLVSTQIKKSKNWNAQMDLLKIDGITPPTFSHIYSLTTVKEENNQGKWYGIQISIDHKITVPEVYNKAKELCLLVTAGKVETVVPETEEKY